MIIKFKTKVRSHSSRELMVGRICLIRDASFRRKLTSSLSLAIMYTEKDLSVLWQARKCLYTNDVAVFVCSLTLSCRFLIVLPIYISLYICYKRFCRRSLFENRGHTVGLGSFLSCICLFGFWVLVLVSTYKCSVGYSDVYAPSSRNSRCILLSTESDMYGIFRYK